MAAIDQIVEHRVLGGPGAGGPSEVRMMSNPERIRRNLGQFLAIPPGAGKDGFARVLVEPLLAFYDSKSDTPTLPATIGSSPVLFKIFVKNSIITKGEWPVVGHETLADDLLVEPLFFKEVLISGKFCLYRDSTNEEIPAIREECAGYEEAAVWDADAVVERLNDHFAGRPRP